MSNFYSECHFYSTTIAKNPKKFSINSARFFTRILFYMQANGSAMGSSAKKAIFLFHSTKIANKPEFLLFNPEPELLPIAIVVSRLYLVLLLFESFLIFS